MSYFKRGFFAVDVEEVEEMQEVATGGGEDQQLPPTERDSRDSSNEVYHVMFTMINLPKPRRRNNTICDQIFLVGYFIFFFGFGPSFTNTSRIQLCVLSLIFIICTFVGYKTVLLLKEIIWMNEYSSVSNFLLKVIKIYNWRSLVIVCTILIIFFVYDLQNYDIKGLWTAKDYTFKLSDILICLPFVVMGLHYEWNDCPLAESYRLENSPLSAGSSMARAFYYGYLQIIIPGLFDELNRYQNHNNLTNKEIPVKRLFVLIPSSTFIYDKLRSERDVVEPLLYSLEPQTQDRALVLGRVYKNTLYKIQDEEKKKYYYVPLEGATPLKTFHNTCSNEPQYKEFRKEVVSCFYYSLEALINEDKSIKDLVELVYYDDEKDPDIEIDKVVLQRIKYIKKSRKIKTKKKKSL